MIFEGGHCTHHAPLRHNTLTLAEIERLSRIVVMPLDAEKGEAGIRREFAANLERMGLSPAVSLLVLTGRGRI